MRTRSTRLGRWLAPGAVVLALLSSQGPAQGAGEDEGDGDEAPKPQKPDVKPKRESSRSTAGGSGIVSTATLDTSFYADTDHVGVFSPSISLGIEKPTAGWNLHGSYLVDVVSAASVDIVSTASQRFREVRHAGSLSGGWESGDFGMNLFGSVSREPDYLSLTGGAGITESFDQKNVVLQLNYTYGHDTAGRSGTPYDVYSHTIHNHFLNGGLSFVVDRATVMVLMADAVLERGDTSKPYRYIPMFADSVAPVVPKGASIDDVNRVRLPDRPLEQLPLARDRYALTWRYLHRFESSTIRFDERLYADTWGQRASSTDLRYLVDVTRRFLVGPHLRFHAQNAVNFWQRAYTVKRGDGYDGWYLPALRTGDRELGPLLTTTIGASAQIAVGPDDHPNAWVLGFIMDGGWTNYLDDLYITQRFATYGAFTLEAEL
jgi:hypothetical protein